jgi:signal transduction histidine kinase
MGIGLAVVRQIVEQHGGTISVRSHAGTGTIVSFSLPLEVEDQHQKDDHQNVEDQHQNDDHRDQEAVHPVRE